MGVADTSDQKNASRSKSWQDGFARYGRPKGRPYKAMRNGRPYTIGENRVGFLVNSAHPRSLFVISRSLSALAIVALTATTANSQQGSRTIPRPDPRVGLSPG